MRLIGMLDSPYVRSVAISFSARLEQTPEFRKYPPHDPGV